VNVYYDPEKFDLEQFGEIQWGEPCYDFDLTVVWRRKADGAFLYAEDSGCSCPSPFEQTGLDDLKPATPLAEFKAHLESRNPESVAIAELLERMHAAGAR
jgi:hypothetical protein